LTVNWSHIILTGMLSLFVKAFGRLMLRRHLQYSIPTLITLQGVICLWLAMKAHDAQRQRGAVSVIESMGGRVEYEQDEFQQGATFLRCMLRRWLPRDMTETVVGVTMPWGVNDADLVQQFPSRRKTA